MTNYCKVVVWLLAYISDIALLCMWMRLFSKKKKVHTVSANIVTCIGMILLSAAMCYIGYRGNMIISMISGLICFVIISALFYEDNLKKLVYYSATAYIIGLSADIIFCSILDIADNCLYIRYIEGGYLQTTYILGEWNGISELFIMLAGRLFKFIVYYLTMRTLSDGAVKCKSEKMTSYIESKFSIKRYLVFYTISMITYIFMGNIYISQHMEERSIGSYVLIMMAAIGIIFINSTALYFFEKIAIVMMQNEEAEFENLRLSFIEKYYKDLDEIHEQYDIFIHDLKHTMRTVAALSEEGRCKEIEELIGDMRIAVGNIGEQIICSHKILNALLNERKGYADECGTVLELEVGEPLYLQNIADVDLIILIGNILDNAIEAEKNSDKHEGVFCGIHMSRNGRHVVIQVENSYKDKKVEAKTARGQNNIGEKHGIGLKSVREIVRKYGGIFDSTQDDSRYNVKVILPIQAEAESEASYTETETVPAYAQSAFK